jgi:hypothetical protein
LALFEGGAGGLTLTSSGINPDLPSPSALVFLPVPGGQVQFYAATEGREAAVLVALSLGGEFILAPLAPGSAGIPTPPVVPQLVPLEASSLAIVGTLLVTTLPSSTGEVNLEPGASEVASVVSVTSAVTVGVGQGVVNHDQSDDGAGGDEQNPEPEQDKAANEAIESAPWKRFIIDTDEAIDRFNRAHPELFPARPNQAPKVDPAEAHSDLQALPDENAPAQPEPSARSEKMRKAIDQALTMLAPRETEGRPRLDPPRKSLTGFTDATTQTPFDVSAALALAATVAGEFYIRSVRGRIRARPRIARWFWTVTPAQRFIGRAPAF